MKRRAVTYLDRIGVGSVVRPIYSALRIHKVRRARRIASSRAGRLIEQYLAENPRPMLQLGTSDKGIPGWLNTDVILRSPGVVYLDCTKPFPIRDETFDFVFCEHLIEHLSEDEGSTCMREVYRCLKTDGVFRLATPDLEKFIGLFARDRTSAQDRYLDQFGALLGLGKVTPTRALNLAMHSWGHKYLYTHDELASALVRAGFSNVMLSAVGSSDFPALTGIERHHEFAGEENNRFETMVIEAIK